jgi:hypothetical protein
MRDIIAEAQKARYTVDEGASGEKGIAISDAWMAELQKHPYHSSKYSLLMLVEKPGTGIFLMKESSKLYRPHKEREQRKLAKRLGGPSAGSSDSRQPQGQQNKRQNLGDGKFTEVPPPKQVDTQMKSGAK